MATPKGTRHRRSARSAVLDQRPEYELLGQWLRSRREQAGITQRAVSRAMRKPEQFLTKVENGHQRIDLIEFLDFARVINLNPQTTFGDLSKALGSALVKP